MTATRPHGTLSVRQRTVAMNTATPNLPMPPKTPMVRHFRQVLIWPLHLIRAADTDPDEPFWRLLERNPGAAGWHRVADEFVSDVREFQERHYKEFVVFLPHVQRFLYGEGRGSATHAADDLPGDSARKVYRRDDVATLRIVPRAGQEALTLTVKHVDLCFFDDVDAAFLIVEVFADNLPLPTALDLLYRLGRSYPTGWNEKGQGVHNALSAEWLGHDGQTLAASDVNNRERYLAFTRAHRAPATSSHWAFLLRPLALDASDEEAPIRYRQVEYHRMPLMAFLAVDDPRAIPRDDWIRLGLVATVHPDEPLSANDPDVAGFESRYCFDRYWAGTDAGPNTRILCSGRAFIVVGEAGSPYFLDNNRGTLVQFRHQYFILFLINHFHRAALLIFSDRLVDAIHDLDIRQPASVRRFRQRIREAFESFLRFTHRYWFHELSERPHMQALNRLCADHLGNDDLYAEVKDEISDMNAYLDSDATRRTNNMFVRLTVVTVFSIIGTVATGFLGMNLFALADQPAPDRIRWFLETLAGVTVILMTAIVFSPQLSALMDILSNDRLPLGSRLKDIFKRRQRDPRRD